MSKPQSLLDNYISTLKACSKYGEKKEYYMTNSSRVAVNFDEVKKEYVKPLSLSKSPCSVDAICFDDKSVTRLIEFKSGKIDKECRFRIRQKIYDSLLILSTQQEIDIDYSREHFDFILVYDPEKNTDEQGKSSDTAVTQGDAEKENCKEEDIQESPARYDLASKVSSLAETSLIRFGLEFFEKYCFRKVYTLTVEEFEKYLENDMKVSC